jgi:hypothetical protein
MQMPEEVRKGLESLKAIFEGPGILKLSDPSDLSRNGFTFYFAVTAFNKSWDFCVSRDQLSDLPAMPRYIASARNLARSLEQRFGNVSPNLFLPLSGEPLEIVVDWPFQPLPMRAASCLQVRVHNFRTGEFAHLYVIVTHQQSMFNLKEDPFQLHAGLVNSVRSAVDTGDVNFYPSDRDHPTEMQPVRLALPTIPAAARDLSHFLKQKVGLMGFRAGGKDTQVWIADPWDADYLGVQVSDLRQEADILEAEGYLALDATRQFAHAESNLLKEFRSPTAPSSSAGLPRGAVSVNKEFDVFLSHASEDKAFVRELAAALKRRGVSYWLDEIELRLGDSLRTVIDAGLANSRFGVVILSHHFFAKQWPQQELDGLLAKEIDRKVILPVWHDIVFAEVSKFSPTLAGRYAAQASEGVEAVADKILLAIKHD